jgi:DNA polymerase-1
VKALIDGDIIRYQVGFACEEEPFDSARITLDVLLKRILFRTEADDHAIYFSSPRNFRKEKYEDYKANRDPSHKPVLYQRIGAYLIDDWNAIIAREGLEADDELGINQNDKTVIVSTDKDLDTVPGWHYNWVRDEKYYLDRGRAHYNFWKQMLMGDASDNIKGLPKVGPKTSARWLDKIPIEFYEEFVFDKYNDYNMVKDFEKNKYLLTIRRSYEEKF